MSSISGFCNFYDNYLLKKPYCEKILSDMYKTLSHRGMKHEGVWIEAHAGFSHANLYMHTNTQAPQYSIIYDGELYNTKELICELNSTGHILENTSDTDIILHAYIQYGPSFVTKLNGIFSFALWDGVKNELLLYRDRIGCKPCFYTITNDTLIFASEPKAMFCHPFITPQINTDSLREILGVGPAHTPGNGIFCGLKEVLPGHYMIYSAKGLHDYLYWDLTAALHTDSYSITRDSVSFLVEDAIKRQLPSDSPVCAFLSGGIDSSIVTAIAATCQKEQEETLNTFSFDFSENDKYFQSNTFQPERDLPYVNIMLNQYKTNHTYLECSQNALFETLYKAVDARDVPGMTDIDASLLYFCSLVAKHNKIALTGECADEIFGGYPWFYRPELLTCDGFPWSYDTGIRTTFLDSELCNTLDLKEYSYSRYQDTIKKAPTLDSETPEEIRRRQIGYLNIKWFMQTLLDRMDRMGMYSGLSARVPFADHRIIDYLFNVPWDMKYQNGMEKALLRDACKQLLPAELLTRKKSPYPKTYHPAYEQLLIEELTKILHNPNAPITPLLDKKKATAFILSHKELGKPWYGQLMAGPQLMAYYIQINYWMEKYHLSL